MLVVFDTVSEPDGTPPVTVLAGKNSSTCAGIRNCPAFAAARQLKYPPAATGCVGDRANSDTPAISTYPVRSPPAQVISNPAARDTVATTSALLHANARSGSVMLTENAGTSADPLPLSTLYTPGARYGGDGTGTCPGKAVEPNCDEYPVGNFASCFTPFGPVIVITGPASR